MLDPMRPDDELKSIYSDLERARNYLAVVVHEDFIVMGNVKMEFVWLKDGPPNLDSMVGMLSDRWQFN